MVACHDSTQFTHRKQPFDLPKVTLKYIETVVDVFRLDILKVWLISAAEYIVNPPSFTAETNNVKSLVSVTKKTQHMTSRNR